MREQDQDTDDFTARVPGNDVSFADRQPERPTTGPGVPREVLLARVRAVTRWAAPAPADPSRLATPPASDGTADPPAPTDAYLDLA